MMLVDDDDVDDAVDEAEKDYLDADFAVVVHDDDHDDNHHHDHSYYY